MYNDNQKNSDDNDYQDGVEICDRNNWDGIYTRGVAVGVIGRLWLVYVRSLLV